MSVAERAAERGELFGLYVHPDFWGTGIADALMEHVSADLADSFTEAVLWVLKDNLRARRFYERNGWEAGLEAPVEKMWAGPRMDGLPAFPEPLPEIQHRTILLA